MNARYLGEVSTIPAHSHLQVLPERKSFSTARACLCGHPTRHSDTRVQLVSADRSAYTLISRRQVTLQAALLPFLTIRPLEPEPSAASAVQSSRAADRGCNSPTISIYRIAEQQVTGVLAPDYDKFAAGYDQLDTGFAAEVFGIPALRQALISAAYGDVLEVAVGTGINLPLYNRHKVQSLVGVDLSQDMLQQAASKSSSSKGLDIVLQQGDVEALAFKDSTFDCVVDTFSLCVFPKPLLALQQMSRVLRPKGKLLLLEHTRSHFPGLGLYQDITAPAVAALGKGCQWNQDLTGLLSQAGLEPIKLQQALGGLISLVEAKKL